MLGGSLGDDVLDGRGGDDTAFYNDVRGPVRVELAPTLVEQLRGVPIMDGTAVGEHSGRDVVRGMENVWGTNQADSLYGDNLANRLLGLGGNDLLVGFNGIDSLDGGAGQDTCEDAVAETLDCEPPALLGGGW
jgi:Ca2+-binding RTX toxin-like protein